MFEFDSSIFIEFFLIYYKNCTTHNYCRKVIFNQKNHFKGDENTKIYEKMDFFHGCFWSKLLCICSCVTNCQTDNKPTTNPRITIGQQHSSCYKFPIDQCPKTSPTILASKVGFVSNFMCVCVSNFVAKWVTNQQQITIPSPKITRNQQQLALQ